MNIVVLPQAADEFEDAAAHYEDKQPGLGQKFRDEVDRHILWIAQHVEIPRLRPGDYRRVNLKVFPHLQTVGDDKLAPPKTAEFALVLLRKGPDRERLIEAIAQINTCSGSDAASLARRRAP